MEKVDELEMHRADYQAWKEAGFESPGEGLAAYNLLLRASDDLKKTLSELREAYKDELNEGAKMFAQIKALEQSHKELSKQYEEDVDEYDALRAKQSKLLTGVANAIRGKPPELTTWSHHDVVDLTEQVMEQLARFSKK